MTRYIKPDAGALAQRSEALMDSGDGAWYPVVGTMTTVASIIGGGVLGIGVSAAFFAVMLPGLFFIATVIAYLSGTVEVSYRSDVRWYQNARYKYWPKLEGTALESMAKPILDQLYSCTIEGHPGSGYGKNCSLCIEREKVMKQLVPNKPTDRSDIDAAKRYIEMKKESDQLVLEEYKKLMIEQ